MRAEEAHTYLDSLAPSTVRMGLERITAALARLGDPQQAVPAIHVAGTNGKGSTCAFLSSCLSQRYRVGFYSSPHLVRVNERFRLNGVPIDDAALAVRVAELLERLGPDHDLTYFEFGTALAFWHFRQERVDLAVIETGLGGRLDATVLCRPLVTAITSIGLDHMELLGNTLEAIAAEKAGIVKPGIPLVVARQPASVLEVFERAAGKLIVEGRDLELVDDHYRGVHRNIEGLELSLAGAHQRINAGVALGCLEALTSFPLTDAQVRQGLSTTRWPGRLELIDGAVPLLLDGAHNAAGVETLAAELERNWKGRRLSLIFGVFADKDAEPMMRRLFPLATSVALTALHSPRSKAPATYEAFARTLCSDVSCFESVGAALRTVSARSDVVVVAGSLHLIGEARAVLEEDFRWLLHLLDVFEPDSDVDTTMNQLAGLIHSSWPGLDPKAFRGEFFALLERFPDADFGTPGPVVHEVERHRGYEVSLRESLSRQPTFLTVTMANRFMNVSAPEVAASWYPVLEQAASHSRAADWVSRAATRYLEHQRARQGSN